MSNDPERDFAERDREMTAWLEKRPVCMCCHMHIQDDHGYHIRSVWLCEQCMEDYREEIVDEY